MVFKNTVTSIWSPKMPKYLNSKHEEANTWQLWLLTFPLLSSQVWNASTAACKLSGTCLSCLNAYQDRSNSALVQGLHVWWSLLLWRALNIMLTPIVTWYGCAVCSRRAVCAVQAVSATSAVTPRSPTPPLASGQSFLFPTLGKQIIQSLQKFEEQFIFTSRLHVGKITLSDK